MCEPVSIGLAIAGGSQILGGFQKGKAANAAARANAESLEGQAQGQLQIGQAQFEAAEFQADTGLANKSITDRLAKDALSRGRFEEGRSRIETAQIVGQQKVSSAGRGVVVDVGSAADLVGSTERIGEIEIGTIRENSRREAQGFKDQGFNFLRESMLIRMKGASALEASKIAAQASNMAAKHTRKAGKTAQTTTITSGFLSAAGTGIAGFNAGAFDNLGSANSFDSVIQQPMGWT